MTVTTSPSSFALARVFPRVFPRVHLAPALVLAIAVARVAFVARTLTRRPFTVVTVVVVVVVVTVMSPARASLVHPVARSRATQ
jgi:multisubunit Na+/H+ antiporter MnhG subunit